MQSWAMGSVTLQDQATGFSTEVPLCMVNMPNTMKPCKEVRAGAERPPWTAQLTESTRYVIGTAAKLTTSNPGSPLSRGPPQAHQPQSSASILDLGKRNEAQRWKNEA